MHKSQLGKKKKSVVQRAREIMGSFTLRPGGLNEPADLDQTKFLYIKIFKFFHFDLLE